MQLMQIAVAVGGLQPRQLLLLTLRLTAKHAAADARPTIGSGPVAPVTVDPNTADARPTTLGSGANVGARLKLKSCSSVVCNSGAPVSCFLRWRGQVQLGASRSAESLVHQGLKHRDELLDRLLELSFELFFPLPTFHLECGPPERSTVVQTLLARSFTFSAHVRHLAHAGKGRISVNATQDRRQILLCWSEVLYAIERDAELPLRRKADPSVHGLDCRGLLGFAGLGFGTGP
ncbi:hypothetical protein ON010_g3781 [Phytophthora cinnamomi]|nr:hypothetical protein ON010_g3781 [Phytophthora cinnamomi]